MADVQVGMAEVDFTPPLGLPLMGNLRDDYAAKGVHDPLMAKAIVLADAAGTCVALLGVDLCMLTREQAVKVKTYIATRCDVPADHILISATHTHSGPATRTLYTAPAASEEAITAFLMRAAEAVLQARADLRPSHLRFGEASEERISFCRRLRCKDGQIHMNWERLSPDNVLGTAGSIDPQVNVLSIWQNDTNAGALVNFALHPAIIGFADDKYSGEYPGVLAAALREMFGPTFITAFFNGCCGDINHIDWQQPLVPGSEYTIVERTGTLLAESATIAMNRSQPVVAGPIKVSSEKVALKRLPISEETYRWSLKACERLKVQPLGGQVDGLPDEHRASTWIQMYERQYLDDHAEVMVIRLGEVAIVGFPGEMFSRFQRQIRLESPARHTLCIELVNDAIGYLPTSEAFNEGGYEPTAGATLYEKDAGERLTASAIRQLWGLFT